ncbi:MAG: hypothetical protein D6744_08415, partial [Planctomycetota bacterium]
SILAKLNLVRLLSAKEFASMHVRHLRRWITFAAALTTALAAVAEPPWLARSTTGMVASDSPEASRIGAQVLADGGNAFDAAIATSFALAVTRPQSTGLGGGGFLVAYIADTRQCVVLDFRESAPAAATPERYARLRAENGDGPPVSVYGGNAVGVPGQVAGLVEIHRRYATQPWADLIAPAVELCDRGFVLDEHFLAALAQARDDLRRWPRLRADSRAMAEWLDSIDARPGARLKRPALKTALRSLARDGAAAFYDGPIAEAIVHAVQHAGGALTRDDLRHYRVREREPLRYAWNGYDLVLMPPPSSGGVCIAETLGILDVLAEPYGGVRALRRSKDYAPMLITALRHAFADRARWLGDPDAADIPVALLTSREHARVLAGKRIRSNEDYGTSQLP